MKYHEVLIAGLLLAASGVLGAGLVSWVHGRTAPQIALNERSALLEQIGALVPAQTIDNDLLSDTLTISAPAALGAEQTRVYRGRRQGEPAVLVFSPVEARGYSGAIRLLVAVRADGRLAGVRVLAHRETPGLGDKIERTKGDWIDSFRGRSLRDPAPALWKVQRDGGVFDQFTGATITPRAVVAAVRQTLEYQATHQAALFAPTSEQTRAPTSAPGTGAAGDAPTEAADP